MSIPTIFCVFLLETYFLTASASTGPEIFKFTFQPVSQTVNPGGSVTLSCVATGRSGITYSWYKLDTDFNTPPSNTDLISGEEGTTYVVQAADVDDSGEERLFQCKATAGSDVILSNVATVLYKLPDSIAYDDTGKSYIDQKQSTPSQTDGSKIGVFLYTIRCNPNELDFDQFITNGEPYDVQWFKTGESGRVENNHKNMWTYYGKDEISNYGINLGTGSYPLTLSNIVQYDLVIVNVQTSDAGTYYCKAVSRVNKQEVLLGSTVLSVLAEENAHLIKPLDMITGYMVLAIDSSGKIRTSPKVGDEVLLMCGVACRTSGGSWDPQYQWKDSSGTVIANTREHIVTLSSTGTVSYTCRITNSECASKLGSPERSVMIANVGDADFDRTLVFTFSKSPPEYMWYDTSDNSKSHDPFEIGCEGSYTSGSTNVVFLNAVLRNVVAVSNFGYDAVYDFGSSFTFDKSGVYQCVMFNDPYKVVLYQQTTNVIITAHPFAATSPTTLSITTGSSATFTCTVGGFPIESVTISGPNNVNVECLTTQTSGNVSCTSSDQSDYVVIVQNFKLEYAGDYNCTVKTELYKADNTAAVEYSAQDQTTLSFEKGSTTRLTASSTTIQYGDSVILTCVVEGYPEPTEPTLIKSGSSKQIEWSSPCTGTNRKECLKKFLSTTYSDSGQYICAGSNTIDGNENKSEDRLDLLIVRSTEVTISNKAISVLTNGTVYVLCTIVGKPLVDISAVSWSHDTLPDLDLSRNVSTVKGSLDNYTLVSILSIVNPSTEYSGIFNCNVQAENDQVITKSVEVSINNKEFLHAPKITHNGGQDIGQDMFITCLVEGFPRPSATLTYRNLAGCEHVQTTSETYRIDHISPTSTEFEFQLSTSCNYSQYKFICETKNIKITDGRVQKESSSADGPVVIGCPSTAGSNTGVLISSAVAALLFVIIVVCGIYILHLRRRLSPNSATGNVVYVNTNPEKLGAGEQSTEQNYETLDEVEDNSPEQEYNDVVLHVSNGAEANVNSAKPSSSALHLYNDVVPPTRTTSNAQYAYARGDDVVRNKVRR